MDIRYALLEDLNELSKIINDVDNSNFMKYDPSERTIDIENVRRLFDKICMNDNSNIFVAVENKKLCGYLILQGEQSNRVRHRAHVVVGVNSDNRGKNVGYHLFEYAHNWAEHSKIHRLHLTVMKNNQIAINLYKKMGYKIEGVSKDSLMVDGKFVDEYYMSKLI